MREPDELVSCQTVPMPVITIETNRQWLKNWSLARAQNSGQLGGEVAHRANNRMLEYCERGTQSRRRSNRGHWRETTITKITPRRRCCRVLLTDTQLTLLADRRKFRPYGLQGGTDGSPGRAYVVLPGADPTELPAKCTLAAPRGSIFHLETPGGGGWGDVKS